MPDTIAEFIAARLDEDEAVAHRAADLPCCEPLGWDAADRWSHRPRGLLTRNDGGRAITLLTPGMPTSTDSGVDLIRAEDGGIPANVADHIVAWDPARALAEIKVKRRILARHRAPGEGDWQAQSYPRMCLGCGAEGEFWDPRTEDIEDCPELRDLASVFAGHPDFNPKWKIDD